MNIKEQLIKADMVVYKKHIVDINTKIMKLRARKEYYVNKLKELE